MIKKINKLYLKVVAIGLIVVLLLSDFPLGILGQVFVQNKETVQIELKEKDAYTQNVSISIQQNNISKLSLFINDKEISSKTTDPLLINQSSIFQTTRNGNYKIRAFDVDNNLLEEAEFLIESFDALTIVKKENNILTILGRGEKVKKLRVSNGEINTECVMTELVDDMFEAQYKVSKNGTHIIESFDEEGNVVGTLKHDVNNFKADSQNQISESQEEVIIAEESDLLNIVNNPQGKYRLANNIVLSNTNKKVLLDINFRGIINGDGYQIKNLSQTLFTSLENATITNFHLSGDMKSDDDIAPLALFAKETLISASSFSGYVTSKKNVSGLILKADQVKISDSYILVTLKGNDNGSGFIMEGNAEINDSYVSGTLSAKKGFGFGKEVNVNHSYMTMGINAKIKTLFTNGKIENSFYDQNLNDIEEPRATPYTTAQMISGNLNSGFYEIVGRYPSIRKEIYETWQNDTIKTSQVSVLALESNENIATMQGNIKLVDEVDKESINWSGEKNLQIHDSSVKVIEKKNTKEEVKSGILSASTKFAHKSFFLQGVTLYENDTIQVGESLPADTTQISFNAVNGEYYKVVPKDSDPGSPSTHKLAIEDGWIKMIGTRIYTVNNLAWNREYDVYHTTLATPDKVGSALTKKAMLAGEITLSDNYLLGNDVVASLVSAQSNNGRYIWQSSKFLSKDWEDIKVGNDVENNMSDSITIGNDLFSKYLRVIYIPAVNGDYTGSVTATTTSVLRQEITSVNIKNESDSTPNKISIEDKLSASILPSGNDGDVIYRWFHEGSSETLYTGKIYTVEGRDVGKKLYVKAIAKATGNLGGEKDSLLSPTVLSKQWGTPEIAPMIESFDDTSMTIKIPESVKEGLYQVGYYESGSTDRIEYPVLVRVNSSLTINKLKPNTNYKFFLRRAAENGYTVSEWSTKTIDEKTEFPYVKGRIEISGDSIFDEVLNATLKDGEIGQSGSFAWYRVINDVRGQQIATGNSIKLTKEDIGNKVEAVFTGTQGLYSGSISAVSEVIEKKDISAPLKYPTLRKTEDTTIYLDIPPLDTGVIDEKYIIGYSTSREGSPVEYRNPGIDSPVRIFEPSSNNVSLSGFSRDTTYYFSIRYSEAKIHGKSDWSSVESVLKATTKKSNLTGKIDFEYKTDETPIQGDKLVARLNDTNTDFDKKGIWTWTRQSKGGEIRNITNFFSEGDDGTYYIIPENEEEGVTYRVNFSPTGEFINDLLETSNAVVLKKQVPFDKPTIIPTSIRTTDTTITIKQPSGAGIYQFRYAEASTPSVFTEFKQTAFSNVEVTISNLKRDCAYIVQARRLKEGVNDASPWSNSSVSIATKKTSLSGYVSFDIDPINGTLLTATYHKADYQPSGDDSKGTWKWYRGSTLITGANSATYTPVNADVGQKLKAEYTANAANGFQGSVSATTNNTTKKMIPIDPKIASFASAGEIGGYLNVSYSAADSAPIGGVSMYYRLQESTESAPTVPKNIAEVTSGKWKIASTSVANLNEDYKAIKLKPNTSYTLYLVKVGIDYVESSNVIASNSLKLGQSNQTGSVSIKGDMVIGKTLIATMGGSPNNIKGSWKWYVSNNDKSTAMPSISDNSKWTTITSGYYPTTDSITSELTIDESMWKKYIKADFVANTELGYTGVLRINASNFVKNIYEETLTITSSTKDGNGNPAAYSGTIITGTINNYCESGNLNTMRSTVVFKVGTNSVTPTSYAVDVTNKKATFTYIMPQNAAYDGLEISAEVSKPKDASIYVDDKLVALNSTNLNSKTSTSSSFKYKKGITINNANDFEKFMKAEVPYTDRTANSEYVFTDNVNMSGKGKIAYSATPFAGTLDGDYHTIVGTKNPIFLFLQGTSEKYANVKNAVFYNADINIPKTGDQNTQSGALIANAGGYANFENLLLADSKLVAFQDTGYLIGRSTYGYFTISNTSTVGGSVETTSSPMTLGTFIGMADVKPQEYKDVYSISTKVNQSALKMSNMGGISGTKITGTNVYVASPLYGTATYNK